ncbi:hypothetical protein DM860_016869 [Cuscuta australis]|uniref:Glutamate receptor n=1 Tax=Cuscuta australis TaxID=267555 RepID=A0A328DXH0_9ASTE|nr:hypothetical protein DM860_016869 [Cuscuta australis]
MKGIWVVLTWVVIFVGACPKGMSKNGTSSSSRPAVVNIGAIFVSDSTIGRSAKIAIEAAVKDVNADPTVLHGTQLAVKSQSSNCSGFLGMVSALKFMETDVVAIIGPQSSVVAHTISHIANELQVPLLSFAATDPTLASLQFPYFIRTTQSDLYQMKAVADIINHYGWREVIAVFIDDDYGRNGVAALDDALSANRCKLTHKAGIPPRTATDRAGLMDIMVQIALMESRVIVLHTYPDSGFAVFSVAHYLGMMNDGYVWISTDWLSAVFDSSPRPLPPEKMDVMQGVLVLRQHTENSAKKKAFSSRWNNMTGGNLGINSYALYAYDSVWLVAHAVDSFLNQGGVISFSNDSNLQLEGRKSNLHLEALSIFDGGPHLMKDIVESDFVGLTGRFKFTNDKTLILPSYDILNVIGTGFRSIGYWSNHSGLSTSPPETLNSKPSNASFSREAQKLYDVIWPGQSGRKPRGWVFPNNGKQLKIVVPIRTSFREFVSHIPGTNTFKGFSIDVFTAAVNLLPYAVPYQFVPFGNGRENPSYNELVRLVSAGRFDGAVGDIAIVTNRTKVVDFTQPYAASGLLVVAPFKKLNTGAWAFLRPFSAQMWAVTAFFFIVVGTVVWILEHRINDEFRGPPRKQLITIVWFSLSTLFFAHRENTVSALGRAVLIIWLFVVLIINSSYTASLTSILTVQQLYSPIKGIESLKEGDDLIGYQTGSFAEHYLVEEIGIPKSRLVEIGSPEAYAAALEKGPAEGGVSAVVDERPYVESFLSSQCKFRIIGQEFTKSGWGFAFPRDSPLAVDMSTAILTLSENGELQRIHDKWLTRTGCSSDDTEIDSDRLHLKSFCGLFLISGGACVIALLIYFTQIILKFRRIDHDEPVGDGSQSSRSRSLQRLISLIDEKSDPTKREKKKRKIDPSLSLDTSNGGHSIHINNE